MIDYISIVLPQPNESIHIAHTPPQPPPFLTSLQNGADVWKEVSEFQSPLDPELLFNQSILTRGMT